MDRRIWGIIIVIFSLVLIAGIIYIIFFYKFSPAAEPVATEQPATQQAAPAATSETPAEPAGAQPAQPLKKAGINEEDLARMASSFAERYGSFSNQSDYGNIRDLQIFMTESMKNWSDNYINDARSKKGDTSIYYGIITKAVSTTVNKYDSDTGQAEILVKTQRRESTGVSGNSSTFYQDIIIKYLRENGVWRVDGVYWQAK